MLVQLDRVMKKYGSFALELNMEIPENQVTGLIGANGAGKSTTIKTVLGLLKDSKAEVFIAGTPPRYAYVPEHPVFYDDLTLWEHMD